MRGLQLGNHQNWLRFICVYHWTFPITEVILALAALLKSFDDKVSRARGIVDGISGVELLRLAEAYDLPKFAAAIEAGLIVSLDSTNALQVLQEAHGLNKLKNACEEKVAEDFDACSQHPEFGKLSAGQLARILKRGDLKVSREEVVLKSVFNWLNISNDKHAFCMLLQLVDFLSFSFENLLRLVRCTSV